MAPVRLRFHWALAMLLAAADQASKWAMLRQVFGFEGAIDPSRWHPPLELSPFLNLVMVWNRGISFGWLGQGGQTGRIVLIGMALAIIVLMVVWQSRNARFLPRFALSLVIGGALGNVIDRLRFGAVADFVDLHVAGWHWPAFNLADSLIVVGVALLLAEVLLFSHRQPTGSRR